MKILLADDSMTAQKMGKEILLAAGHEVVTVSNGAAAVKKIASERPDVAVLDVYMPGYTGLEVCERIKSDPATAGTPVLLTHGKMENYSAADGARVKADGVIIKPFEASDLTAAVQKLGEQKSAAAAAAAAPAAEEPAYQKTAKFNVKELLAADPSYNEWKTSAVEHVEDTMESGARTTNNVEVPHEMASTPAFGMEEEAAPPPVEHPTMAEPPATVIAPFPHEPAPVEMELSTAPPPAPLIHARDPHLEPTSARDTTEVEHVHDPNFEAPLNHREIKVEHAAVDPALITDPDQMNAEFKTTFGVEHPDDITVGVAADIPGLYADSAPPVADTVPPTEDVSTAAQQVAPPEHDFDARVAEAMSAFDSQKMKAAEEPPAVQEPPKAEEPKVEAEPDAVVEVMETNHEAPPPAADLPPTMKLEPSTEKFAPPTESVPVAPEEPAPSWKAQTITLDSHEHGISLEDEMQKAFAAAAHAEPEPAPVVAPPAPPEPAPVAEKQAPDLQLAAEMAAAIGADEKVMAAAAGAEGEPHVDHEKIMTAVFNVFERMKPELIEQVKRELKEKK